MAPFFSALRFLTIFPIPQSWCGDENDFSNSPNWYPAVGLFIGVLMVGVDFVLRCLLPLSVASVLLLVAMIAVSGALHLDGLADSADAFFSSRGRKQMLEIMKDSRSGPMGVTAIILVLLLKLMLLIALPAPWRWQVILLMPLVGRSALSVVSCWLPYARQEGIGAFTALEHNLCRPATALLVCLLTCIVLLGSWGIVIFALTTFVGWLLGYYSNRKIGGFTGDVLGAICELVELVPVLSVVALHHLGGM